MAIASFAEMVDVASKGGPIRVAVAAAAHPEVLAAISQAQEAGFVDGILVGDESQIHHLAQEHHIHLGRASILHEPEGKRAAILVVGLVAEGEAQVIVKGQIKTEELLSAALRREGGIRESTLLSHVGIFEIPRMDRLIYISDSGVVIHPDIYQKLEITQNVVNVAHCFGLTRPKVAVLSATEDVDPRQPVSIDGLALSKMARQGWVERAVVDGPMALDVAISAHSARVKGIGGPVAGQADILIVPNVEAGNILAKSIQYFGRGRMAGLVVGARAPILISSRADSAETRFFSLAMASLIVHHQRKTDRDW